jgi:hypothetical protein
MPTTPPKSPLNSATRPTGNARSPGAAAASSSLATARSASPPRAARASGPARAGNSADPSPAADDLAREAVIRLHAYTLWERRGRSDGHAMEDWLQAEAELAHLAGRPTARLQAPGAEGAH